MGRDDAAVAIIGETPKAVADGDGVGHCPKRGERGRQLAQRGCRVTTNVGERRRGDAVTAAHDWHEELNTVVMLVRRRHEVAGHCSVFVGPAPDLLAPGPIGLAGGQLAARNPVIFLKFVSTVERRCVGGGCEACPDTKAIDGHVVPGKDGKLILVEFRRSRR